MRSLGLWGLEERKPAKKQEEEKIINPKNIISRIREYGEASNDLEEWEIKALCSQARDVFCSQPMLLELYGPLKIIGSIHGHFHQLIKIFEFSGEPGDVNYLFLGNYIDRGPESIPTIILLLAYKLKYPKNVFLLRGNHESAYMSRIYGLYDECNRKYNLRVWKYFCDMFNFMPLAALVLEKIFCVHSGISPELQKIEKIRRIERPIDIPKKGIVCDLVWSQPHPNLKGWEEHSQGISYSFGEDVLTNFMNQNSLELIIRGNQVVEDGFSFIFGKKIINIFSAPNFMKHFDNSSGIIKIDQNLECSFQKKSFEKFTQGIHYVRMRIQEDSKIDSVQQLQAYMTGNHQIYQNYSNFYPHHLRNQELLIQIRQLNNKLQDFSYERIGDLTNPNSRQISKTIRLVGYLISEQSKWKEAKINWNAKIRQLEKVNDSLKVSLEKLEKDKKFLENDKYILLNKKKQMEKRSHDQLQKMLGEKQELNKRLRQHQIREKGIEIQFRKKEKDLKTLRDTIHKYQEKVPFKNNFEIIHKISEFGPSIFTINDGQHEYNLMAVKNLEENLARLQKENQYLKDCLKNIYKQLSCVLQLKKQTLRRRGNDDCDFENSFELFNFRPETLCLPQNLSSEGLQNLNQNLYKFKQAIKYGDETEVKIQNKKEQCLKGIKQVLRNYKDVAHSQDQMLNKVMLKVKQLKQSEAAQIDNRFAKILDNNELERAKRFVREQEDHLVSKNSFLEKKRRSLQEMLKKVEDNKIQMMRRKCQFEEEAISLRNQIQVIPLMVEQELQKR